MASDDEWGFWGNEPPCEHMLALREFLIANWMDIWGEFTDDGFVNVSCERCSRTYETTLRFGEEDESDD